MIDAGGAQILAYFDPLGFSADGDKAVFLRRGEAEIMHDRITTLATMGD